MPRPTQFDPFDPSGPPVPMEQNPQWDIAKKINLAGYPTIGLLLQRLMNTVRQDPMGGMTGVPSMIGLASRQSLPAWYYLSYLKRMMDRGIAEPLTRETLQNPNVLDQMLQAQDVSDLARRVSGQEEDPQMSADQMGTIQWLMNELRRGMQHKP